MKTIKDFVYVAKVDTKEILDAVGSLQVWEKEQDYDSAFLSDKTELASVDESIFKLLSDHVGNYCKQHGTSIQKDEGYKVMRFGPDQYNRVHVDNDSGTSRLLSVVLTLNNDYEGGMLSFPELGLQVDSKENNLVIFPSNFMFKHEVFPVTAGTKYSVVTWLV